MYVRACVCGVCLRACVRMCVHTYVCMHACMRACVRACVRACMRACVRVQYELPKLYKTLIVVVRRTLANLHTYNVRMRPPAVSADEVLAWIPWHSVIFAIGKSMFAKKNCALLCSHSSACVGKANRAFFATCCFTEGLCHC